MAISFNQVTLIGRLGADPERVGREGQIVRARLATSESWKSKQTGEREERVQWHQVVVFAEPAARFLAQYARKGDLVLVRGQLEHRKWEKDGEERWVSEVVIRPYSGEVQLASSKREEPDTAPRARASLEPSGPAPDIRSGQGSWNANLDDEIPF